MRASEAFAGLFQALGPDLPHAGLHQEGRVVPVSLCLSASWVKGQALCRDSLSFLPSYCGGPQWSLTLALVSVGQVNYPKVADSSSFDEDSSDALSPEQPASHESQGSVPSPLEARVSEPLPSATSMSPTQVSLPTPKRSASPHFWGCLA